MLELPFTKCKIIIKYYARECDVIGKSGSIGDATSPSA